MKDLIDELRNLASQASWASEPMSNAADALESQEREIELWSNRAHKEAMLVVDRDAEIAALKSQPSGVVLPPMAEFDDIVDQLFSADNDARQYCSRKWMLTVWKASLDRVCQLNSSPVCAGDKCECSYGPAPHECFYKMPGAVIGESKPLPRSEWPSNFSEDANCLGMGTYRCNKCCAAASAGDERVREALRECLEVMELHRLTGQVYSNGRAALSANHSEQVRHDLAMAMHQRDHYANRVFVLELGIGKIAADFIPSKDDEAPIALVEMRDALEALLAAAPPAGSQGGDV